MGNSMNFLNGTNRLTAYPVADAFSLAQTFECGQCFRWEALGPEIYRGVAFGRAVCMSLENGLLTVTCEQDE